MARLTDRQAEILNFIREYIIQEDVPPTVREIAEEFGIKSTNAIVDHLKALERKGAIERDPRSARGIRLPEAPAHALKVPILGQIAAGSPIFADENLEGWVTVGDEFASKGELFALNVRGDSMIEAHIADGDTVLVRKQETAERGQIVAAMMDGSATLKIYQPQGNTIMLLPANEAYDPIVFDKDSEGEFIMLGIAVGLIREQMM